MPSGNGLGDHYIVDASVLSAAGTGHPKANALFHDFANGKAHLCSHTWSDAKETDAIPAPLLATKPTPLAATEQAWAMVNVLALQINRPAFVPYSLIEPKVLIVACASCAGYQIVTEDVTGTFSLSQICIRLRVPSFRLSDI